MIIAMWFPAAQLCCVYLSVEAHCENVVRVAVVANFCALFEVVDIHATWHGLTHHHHQAAGEKPFHDIHIWSFCWRAAQKKTR